MAYIPPNPNGQATSANSAPVVVASDNILNVGKTLAITNTISALNGDLIPSTDVSAYTWATIQITGTFAATYTFQGSNDNFATVFAVPGWQVTSGTPGQVTASSTSNILWQIPITFRYLRVRVTAYTSGSVVGTSLISAIATPPFQTFSTVNGAVTTTPPNATGTGSITTSSSSVALNNNFFGGGFSYIQVSGTYAGVSFGVTMSTDNGTTFLPVPVYDLTAGVWLAANATITPGTNATRGYMVQTSPATNQIRVLATAWTSGTANIRMVSGQSGVSPSTMTQDNSTGLTGATLPTSASLMGITGSGGLVALNSWNSIGDSTAATYILASGNAVFNGSSWDRMRSTAGANGTTGTGVLAAGNTGQFNTTQGTITSGNYSIAALSARGAQIVVPGVEGFPVSQTGTWSTIPQKSTVNGLSTIGYISAASTNSTSLKASAGQVYAYQIFNTSTNVRYVKFYNSATAPTAGTGTPVKRLMVPAGGGLTWTSDIGIAFATGIAFTITGGVADADTTNTTANDILLNIDYA